MFHIDDQWIYRKESTAGRTVQVAADTFLDHYTNLLHSQQDTNALVSHVKRKLKASKDLTRNGWVATNVKGPTEDSVSKRLEDIAESIHDHCVEWNKTKQHPSSRNARLVSSVNRAIQRPLGRMARKLIAGMFRHRSCCRCRIQDSSDAKLRVDNESKALGAIGHIFYADPCRRSVMAFTIEDHMMRFWYFSRSHIAVSAEFDYHANPRLFIHFVIFMTFASLEDLGYDPTVKRIHTIGVIHEMNLDIVTRATRVLKDVWLYFDAKPESDIYNEIFAALRQLDEDGNVPESERPPPLQPGSSLEEDAKNYFLTIVSDSVVTINGRPDEAQEPPAGYSEFFYTEEEDKVAMRATVDGSKLKRADGTAYPHKKRTHRRIVFEEVCHTLYEIFSYADFTKGLAQLVYGLEYMRLAGFVHGDISPGNCLIYKGQTKISDLEYARPYAFPGHGAAPLIGTPGFMAVEYQVGTHLFEPLPVLKRFRPGMSSPPKKAHWFKFNFLHDLESVLWIYLWFLLKTLPESFTPAEVERHRNPIVRLNHMLFDGSLKPSVWRFFFMEHCATDMGREYNEVITALTAVYGVDSKLPKALESFQCLAGCYHEVESSKPLLPESQHMTHWDRKVFLHEYYQYIHFYFMDAHEQMKDNTDKAIPIWYTDQEAKHRARQAARPSKKRSAGTGRNKRPRMGADQDSEACLPPVVEDAKDDESGWDSDAPPSPTEESQNQKVGAGKRKRGGRA
ncbi:hypothetical protein BDZ89DRAFT_1138803 [Hymenopellis radicata]|nr:hypothetical protein BDZ89DRAFT_1138803 [Hymenopellis radicata]